MADKEISKRHFKTTPLLATDALVLQARLFRLMGPAIHRLPEIIHGMTSKATDEEKAYAETASILAFSDIFSSVQPEELAKLIKDLIEVAQIRRASGDYEQCDLDGDFTGKQGDIIPVVVWILQEQFGDFFSGLPGVGSQSRRRKS